MKEVTVGKMFTTLPGKNHQPSAPIMHRTQNLRDYPTTVVRKQT